MTTSRSAAAQRHVQRQADVRTWFGWQWFWAFAALAIVAALPAVLGDGPIAEVVWLIAVALGLVMWGIWVVRRHAAEAPARRAAAARAALAFQQAQAEAARLAAERTAYLAPRQIGTAWRHGACVVNHRTPDAALRCRRG